MLHSQTTAIRFSRFGGHSVLSQQNIPLPALGKTDVLVRNKAIGVNFIDIYHRSGLYPISLPSGLGKEGAGVVEAVGRDVSRVKPGDRVSYVRAPLGAYSHAHVMDQDALILLPDDIAYKTAAAMMLKGLTAAYLLLKTHLLKPSDTILVHAAAGGVGSILTSWAKMIGATVIGTVGQESKVEIAKTNGCDEVLLYRQQDIPHAVNAITGGKGVDVVYDSVGKDTFEMSLDSLKKRGLMVSFGNASGAVPDFPPLLLSQKGSIFLTRPVLFDYIHEPAEQQQLANALFAIVQSKQLSINVNYQLLLSEAEEAHCMLESGATTGSIVLIPDEG
ncbi:quinone oxidoreductase [Candidatus Endobugula sertula]|uniref:NADPH:quinone reductase n=1 Tax=Candidatus Endobugula sertula TaxID=62101 RepID=A0A1D2QSL4_9GAMM|nr:quinone oxidoreductase [Candidatus Endobugula sertula]